MSVRRGNLFARVARWRTGPARNPGEDRLTEIFAAALERVPGLAHALALRWLDPKAESQGAGELAVADTERARTALARLSGPVLPRVATQLVDRDRRVDLELWFAAGTANEVVIRVEVKHGTRPHSQQIPAYFDGLRHHQHKAVVLLAPRSGLTGLDPIEVPGYVPRRSWQRTARQIANFHTSDDVHNWLCNELCGYLYQEQLMDPEALRPEHLTALAYHGEAASGLRIICDRATEYLQRDDALGPINDSEPMRSHTGTRYSAWWEDPPGWDSGRWHDAWFDWGIDDANAEAEMPTVHVYAGLSFTRDSPFAQAATSLQWQQPLIDGIRAETAEHAEPVRLRYWRGSALRLRRVAHPQDVLR